MRARNEEFLHPSGVTRPRVWTDLLLNETYKVGSLIEQGAAAELYDGIEVSTGEPVALKILLPQLAEDAKIRALFLDEARALRRLSQPGLLRYRACARDPQYDLTYIVTDVVGMRMSSRLASRKLNEEDIVALTKRLALALAAAHGAGVIHRGLRPHAIALPQGRASEATITDFNLIAAAHEKALIDQDYCAPEQSSSSGEGAVVGPWTDVYSLALVILSAVEGKQSAAERKTKPDLAPLPAKLRAVFERMLEPKPSRRLQSMDDLVKELDLALGSAPLLAVLKRTQAAGLARVRRLTERETRPEKQGPDIAELLRQAKAAAAPEAKPPTAPFQQAQKLPAPSPKPEPVAGVPMLKQPTPAPAPAPSPLLDWPPITIPPKPVSLAKFHEAHAAIGAGGYARRFAVALSALLLAASPWIVQTTLRGGQADASTVAPTQQVETASAQPKAKAIVLPKGRVYGADNTYSRLTLRIHRPTIVTVNGREGRLLFSRAVQAGDSYRVPNLPNLTVSTEDAGALEVLLNGTSAGFVGANGASAQRTPLARFASLAPRPAAPATPPRTRAASSEPPAVAVTPPVARVETPGILAPIPEQTPPDVEVVEQPAPQEVAKEAPPAPPPPVEEAPAPPVAVADLPAPVDAEQQAVSAPPAPQPEARRRLIDRVLFWRNREAAPEGAAAVILAPAITKEAADRQQAASDAAKAAREAAEARAREENRRRDASFANSARGINTQY